MINKISRQKQNFQLGTTCVKPKLYIFKVDFNSIFKKHKVFIIKKTIILLLERTFNIF